MIKTLGLVGALVAQSVLPVAQPSDSTVPVKQVNWMRMHVKKIDDVKKMIADPINRDIKNAVSDEYVSTEMGYLNEKMIISIYSVKLKRFWVYNTNMYQAEANTYDLNQQLTKAIDNVIGSITHQEVELDNFNIMNSPDEFKEHDNVEFLSSWGVKNSDSGNADFKSTINDDIVDALIGGVIKSSDPDAIIQHVTSKLKGVDITPMTKVSNPPVEHGTIDYSMMIGGKTITAPSYKILLPKGADSGVEWWHGLVEGVGVGSLLIPGLGEILGPEVVGATESVEAIAAGTLGAEIGSGAAEIGGALAEEVVDTTLETIGDGIDEAFSTITDSKDLAEIGKLLLDGAKDEATKKIKQFISKKIKEKAKDLLKDKIKEAIKNDLKTISIDLSSKITGDGVKPLHIPVSLTDYSGPLDLHSILHGDAKATSLFGDKSVYSHTGDFVTLDYDFTVWTVAFDDIYLTSELA